jgi:fatty acid elongase 3
MKYCALLHNFNMMVISFVCLIGLVYEVSVAYTKDGMYAIICDPHQKYNNGKIIIWIYFYYISKYIELFDTFLLVLRRSQLRFIHTYHHVTTMFITFFGLATGGTGQWIIITLNVFVHVIMYYYYVQVTLGRHVWWKTYVTDIQLTQFAIDVLFLSYYIYAELVYERPIGNSCSGDLTGAILCDIIVSSFFVLFFQLRQRNLRAARAKESSQKQQSLEKKLQ